MFKRIYLSDSIIKLNINTEFSSKENYHIKNFENSLEEYFDNKSIDGVIYDLGRYDLLGKRAKKINNNIRLIELNGLGHLPQIEDFETFYSELGKVLLN